MIDQDFIMLIMNCQKYQKKALFQKMTWLKQIPLHLKYYHVIGDESLDTEFRFDNDTNILYVNVADDYNSLPKKVIAAYSAVNKIFNFKYLFKTDDDQILVNDKFFDMLCGLIQAKQPTPHYGGFIVDIKQPYLSEYHRIHPELPQRLPLYITKYCSGRFYFLSSEAIQDLISKRERIEREFLEDYAIGFNLNLKFKQNILLIATNKYFTDIELSDFPRLVQENKI
jgi:Galactosyltransferase